MHRDEDGGAQIHECLKRVFRAGVDGTEVVREICADGQQGYRRLEAIADFVEAVEVCSMPE